MTPPTVELGELCRWLRIDPNRVRLWKTREIISLPMGRGGVAHRFDQKFALRLAVLTEASKAIAAVPSLSLAWKYSEVIVDLLDHPDFPQSVDVYLLFLAGENKTPDIMVPVGPSELADTIQEARKSGFNYFVVVEVGETVRNFRDKLHAYIGDKQGEAVHA